MNKVQQSFQDNLEEIKKNLPEEFQADLEAEIAAIPAPAAPLTGEAEVTAIKAELKANPDVDDAVIPDLTVAPTENVVQPTQEEQDAEMKKMLAEREAEGPADS